MAVARASLRSDIWDTLYTYLQTTDPISTNNIFSAMNSTLVESKGYPLVILYPPNVSFNKLSVSGEMSMHEANILIEVYDDNSQDCKALADEVTEALLAGRKTFAGDTNRMMRMQIDSGDTDSWIEGKKKIHRISFDVTFMLVID